MGAIPLAAEAAERAADRAPGDASAWERLGRLRLAQLDGPGAIPPLERARLIEPSLEGLLDLALAHHLAGDVGTEVSVCEEAIRLSPQSGPAWARFAHALARTERVAEGIDACERALELGDDAEVAGLLANLRERTPRVLPHRSAAA
jgi:tetratricopeptide (TPR) repeat protein